MLRPHDLRPNEHSLRLIKRSAARHKVGSARHVSSWNSRPVTPKKKFKTRPVVKKNKPLLAVAGAGDDKVNSTGGVSKRRRPPKPPSFEDMLRADVNLHPRRKEPKKQQQHQQQQQQQQQQQRRNNARGNNSTARNRTRKSLYEKPTSGTRRESSSTRSWTRTGMRTGPSRAKVANIARRTQRPELRAKSAPSSDTPVDNKHGRSSSRRSTTRSRGQRSIATRAMPIHPAPSSRHDDDGSGSGSGSGSGKLLHKSVAAADQENSLNQLNGQKDLRDPLGSTHHSFGTIDTTLLDSKRPMATDEPTPGGVWGDGVGLDLSTILECSIESQSVASFASFLSPASQRLMQLHLSGIEKSSGSSSNNPRDSSCGNGDDGKDDHVNVKSSGVRRSSSFTSGMTTFHEDDEEEEEEEEDDGERDDRISPEQLAGGWRVFHRENEEEEEEEEEKEEERPDQIQRVSGRGFVVCGSDDSGDEKDDDDDVVEMKSTEFVRIGFRERHGEVYVSEQEDDNDDDEQVLDECGPSPSPPRSESSSVLSVPSVLDEVLDAADAGNYSSSNEEYDEESFADDYSEDGFDTDEEEENLKGIASDLKQLSTLAPGEFQSLLGVLQAGRETE